MQNTQGKQTDLSEAVSWSGATVEDGVIKGIKLLGERSKNGNHYPTAVRKAAHKVMEGCRVNLNHPTRTSKGEDRPVECRVGKLVNVREAGDGTYADFEFLTKHPMAGAIMEAAQRMPDLYGFSINGKGRVRSHKGENIVEAIDSLRSVDLVADPATTKSLFESEDAPEAKSCEQIIGELIAALVAEGKEDLVKDAIKLRKKLGGGDAPAEGAEEMPTEEAPTEESWKQDYEKLKLEKSCRQLLESAKVTADETLVEGLMFMPHDKARSEFIAWHKRTRNVKAPKSSEPKVGDRVEPDWKNILRSR